MSDYDVSCDKQTIFLVGLKSDIDDKKVNQDEIKKYCDKHDLIYYNQSAKSGTNFSKMFQELAYFQYEKSVMSPSIQKIKNIQLICSFWSRKLNIFFPNQLNSQIFKFIVKARAFKVF